MRYLFVTVDGGGSLYPQLALGQRLATRGHAVRFLACRSQAAAVTGAGFPCRTYAGDPDFDMADRAGAVQDWHGDSEAGVRSLCDVIWFGPAEAVARDVLAEAEREHVDAIVVDYFAFGAAIAAERLGLPTAIVWHTAYTEWADFEQLGLPAINAARTALGLEPDDTVYDAFHRARCILDLITERFAGPRRVPPNLVYVGPQLPPGREPEGPSSKVPGTTVLVSLGTSFQDQEGVLSRVVEALGGLDVRALVGTGRAVGHQGPVPDNVEISAWIEHSAILPETDLVISHAGLGTIMAATAYGVPMLCVPLGRDQHPNAARVVELGIGHRVDAQASVQELREAVGRALADRSLLEKAREAAAECRDRYDDAALALEALGSAPDTTPSAT
jgi:UDP:flavonoid glycosyltransferase YjiC (YdhE family)